MMPQQQPPHDAEALQELGRASVEIVHDIKNQLNGLKLYATFLRKRSERDGRPADELETVNKIAAGLERAASDLNLLVRFGRGVELRCAPHTDLAQIVRAACDTETIDASGEPLRGEFDAERLTEALREIAATAHANATAAGGLKPVSLRREEKEGGASAIVEWRGVVAQAHDKNLFRAPDGLGALRVALAAKIISAHGGAVEHQADAVSVRLPLKP